MPYAELLPSRMTAPDPQWRRTLWVLFFANVATATGMMAMVPFLTFFVEELGVEDPSLRNLWSGIIVGAAPVVAALMGPVWGAISDRVGRKIMVLRALGAIMIFVGLMGVVTDIWVLLLLRVLQGFFSGYIPTSITFVSVMAPEEEQGRIASRIQSAMPAGMVGGFLIGGFLSELGYIRWIFPLCAFLAALSFVAVAVMTKEPVVVRETPGRPRPSILKATRDVIALPVLMTLLSAVCLVRLLVSTVDPVYARYVLELGGDKRIAGFVMSAQAVCAVIAMPRWGRLTDRIGPSLVFVLSGAGVAAAFLAQGLAQDVPQVFVARCCAGLFLAGVFPAAYVLAGREAPQDRRGAAMGVVFMAMALSHAIGSMIGGTMLNLVGFRGLFAIIAGVVFALSGTGLFIRRRRRRAVAQSTS